MIKKTVTSAAGLIGGLICGLFGGWNGNMTTLVVFMAIDWLSGMICAGVFKASRKTESGGLSSKVGFIGLAKKCMMMLFVLVGARLDLIFGMTYIRDSVCIAFTANELLSVIENAGYMGLPVPEVVKNAVDVLRSKEKKK